MNILGYRITLDYDQYSKMSGRTRSYEPSVDLKNGNVSYGIRKYYYWWNFCLTIQRGHFY